MEAYCRGPSVLVLFFFSLFSFYRTYSQCTGLPPISALGSNKVPAGLCAPVSANFIYSVQFASPVPAGALELIYDWGDESPSEVVVLISGGKTYREERTHDFPQESGCEYIVTITVRYNGKSCTNTRQIQKISSWRTDEFNGGLIGLKSPLTGTMEHLVCEGSNISVIFRDESIFNCNSQYIQSPPDPIESPNTQDRWQQIIYNGPVVGNKIPNISVNGVLLTSSSRTDILPNYADPRGIRYMASPVLTNDARQRSSLEITAPGGTGAGFPKSGDVFAITLRYWNFCNPYDDPNIPGLPADLDNGDHRPIEKTAVIRVIAPPAAPGTSSETVCHGIMPKAFSVTGVPAVNTIRWYENIPNPDRAGRLIGTGKTLAVTSHPEWISNTTPGVYKVWASQQPSSGAVTCEGPKTMVSRTIREKLELPETLGAASSGICNGSTLSVSVPAAPGPIGGPVKYIWQGSDGVSLVSASGSQASFAVDVRTFSEQLSAARTITVSESYSAAPSCSVSKQYPVTVYQKPSGGVLSSIDDVCEGSPMDTIILNGHTGTIKQWELKKDPDAFTPIVGNPEAAYIAPGILAPGKYVFRAVVGNGSCAETFSSESAVEVFAVPAQVSAGADKFYCSSLVSEPLGAAVPQIGTGRWSYISSVPAGLPAPLFSDVTDPNTTLSISAVNAGAYTIRWTVSNGICDRSDEAVIDFGTTPSDAFAGADLSICGKEATLQGNVPQKGIGHWTVVNGPQNCQGNDCDIIIENPATPASGVRLTDTNRYGTFTLRWSISSGGNNCFLKTDDVALRFDKPVDVVASDTEITCVDPGKLLPIALSGTVAGTPGNAYWANVNGHGQVSESISSTGTVTASYTPALEDYISGTPVRVRLVAVPQQGSVCSAIERIVAIPIDRTPVANAGVDMPFICSDEVTLHADIPMYGALGAWSTSNAALLFSDKTDPHATVKQLPASPARTSVTWTVTSASGRCVSDPSTIRLSRVSLPDVADVDVTQCEIANGTTGIVLSQFENSVTTLSVEQRSITWYRTPAEESPLNAAAVQPGVSNGDSFYAQVKDTRTGCSDQAQLTVGVSPAPRTMDGLVMLCEEEAGRNKVSGVDLSEDRFRDAVTTETDVKIRWYASLSEAQNDSNPIIREIDVVNGQDFYARITKYPPPFCHSVARATIVVSAVPVITAIYGRESVCQGHTQTPVGELPFETYQVTPVPGAKYYWEIPQGSTEFKVFGGGRENDFYLLLQFPNVYTGKIKVRVELNGCSGPAIEKQIRVNAAPVKPAIVGPSEVYEGASGVPFSVSPNNYPSSAYNWEIQRRSDNSFGGATIVEGQATGNILVNMLSEDIVLSVRENNAMCVSTTARMIVTVKKTPLPEDPAASFQATPTASCFPATIRTENRSTGTDTYSWTLFNESGIAATSNLINPQFRIPGPGTYRLQLIASQSTTGESDQMQISGIRILDVPYAAFDVARDVTYTDTELKLVNYSARADTYQWSFGDDETSMSFEPVHTYHKEGTYRITLLAGIDHGQQDTNGDGVTDGSLTCYDTAAMEVTVRDGGYIQIPNAFTPDENGPNGGRAPAGGFNDVFMPVMRGVETYKMQIFDRWGTKVFETRDPEIGWDGYDRSGGLMKPGVYIYKIEVTLHNGIQDTRIGDIGLIH